LAKLGRKIRDSWKRKETACDGRTAWKKLLAVRKFKYGRPEGPTNGQVTGLHDQVGVISPDFVVRARQMGINTLLGDS